MDKNITRTGGKQEFFRILWTLLGVAVYAAAFRLFVSPAGLYSGGFVGIAQILRNTLRSVGILKDADITGVIYWILNVPVFLIALKNIGRKFVFRTAMVITVQSLLMQLIPVPQEMLLNDSLLNSIVGGALAGFGVGLILRSGASGGGTDIIGVILVKKFQNFSVGRLSMMVNIAIYVYAAIFYDLETAAYSMVVALVNAMMVDKTFTQTIKQTAFVISEDKNLGKTVISKLGRGVTSWECKGEYTDRLLHAYMVTLDKHELIAFHRILQASDSHVFCSVMHPDEVIGNFKKHLGS